MTRAGRLSTLCCGSRHCLPWGGGSASVRALRSWANRPKSSASSSRRGR